MPVLLVDIDGLLAVELLQASDARLLRTYQRDKIGGQDNLTRDQGRIVIEGRMV
jgi:hypothetical protein